VDYNELITDIEKTPVDSEGVANNIGRLLKHAKYLEGRKDVDDPFAKGLLDTAPSFIRKQIERLELHLGDDVDIIAWIARNLMELFFTLRYMYSSQERYDEVIGEQLKDLKEIEDLLFPGGSPEQDAPGGVKAFHSDMQKLWEGIEKYGVKRDDLRRPNTVKHYAEGAKLMHEYILFWRIHSKYVHPTSYLLFGRKNVVCGDDPRRFFLSTAQYYAARNLSDLHKMIEAASNGK
jgi:hypothetical protein